MGWVIPVFGQFILTHTHTCTPLFSTADSFLADAAEDADDARDTAEWVDEVLPLLLRPPPAESPPARRTVLDLVSPDPDRAAATSAGFTEVMDLTAFLSGEG